MKMQWSKHPSRAAKCTGGLLQGWNKDMSRPLDLPVENPGPRVSVPICNIGIRGLGKEREPWQGRRGTKPGQTALVPRPLLPQDEKTARLTEMMREARCGADANLQPMRSCSISRRA